MRILAIIPARGGSKRLPGKNVKKLGGKPLIQWSIDSALNAKSISRLIVSTDSIEIAEVASKAGATIPFLRPSNLASDSSTSIDVVKHALDFYKNNNEHFDYVLLLQPTSPFRTSTHIEESIRLLKDRKADSIISISECEHSPIWTNTIPKDLSMVGFIKNHFKNMRSQDLPRFYKINGSIYLTSVNRLLEENSFITSSNSYAYIMDTQSSVDIDSNLDFIVAEALISNGH